MILTRSLTLRRGILTLFGAAAQRPTACFTKVLAHDFCANHLTMSLLDEARVERLRIFLARYLEFCWVVSVWSGVADTLFYGKALSNSLLSPRSRSIPTSRNFTSCLPSTKTQPMVFAYSLQVVLILAG